MKINQKKFNAVIFGLVISLLVSVYIFSSNPVYFGYVEINDKKREDNNYGVTLCLLNDSEDIIQTNLNEATIYINEKETIPLKKAWGRIKVGEKFQVSMEKPKFPYNLYKNSEIKTFYMD